MFLCPGKQQVESREFVIVLQSQSDVKLRCAARTPKKCSRACRDSRSPGRRDANSALNTTGHAIVLFASSISNVHTQRLVTMHCLLCVS